ncbi:hypothetical protein VE03_07333 [Pseudogymnoascus sp. 23342-1-I1]|nr:hypothetical protein VE03_07333 [Pseudogymnoascus sp. 23342-1-I1]
MSSYHDHKRQAEELNQWGKENPEEWEENELHNNEELLAEIEAEREGRERAREEYGADADEGHNQRIEKLKDTEQVVRNRIGYCKGEYSYGYTEQDHEDEADVDEQDPKDEDEADDEEQDYEEQDYEDEDDDEVNDERVRP